MSLDWGPGPDDRLHGHGPPERSVRFRMPGRGSARRSKGRRILLRALIALVLAPFILTLVYTMVPPVSTLMLARWVTLRPVEREWVPLDAISPALPRAVIGAEDAKFCRHAGVDWGELRAVLRQPSGPTRGASTISMQVAKNLYLWQGGGYLRKPIEIVLAHWIELVWSKRRLMEVYLNTVEWGPNGVFGAEAIARKAFRKSAAQLTPREAAILTAALPNPIIRNSARPSRGHTRRASTVAARAPQADTSCLGRR